MVYIGERGEANAGWKGVKRWLLRVAFEERRDLFVIKEPSFEASIGHVGLAQRPVTVSRWTAGGKDNIARDVARLEPLELVAS